MYIRLSDFILCSTTFPAQHLAVVSSHPCPDKVTTHGHTRLWNGVFCFALVTWCVTWKWKAENNYGWIQELLWIKMKYGNENCLNAATSLLPVAIMYTPLFSRDMSCRCKGTSRTNVERTSYPLVNIQKAIENGHL